MGQLDVPLGADGRAAARAARTRFSTICASRVVTSPLQRARHTAEELYPELPALVDHRLAERHLGEWEGALKSDVKRLWPDAFLGDHLDPSFTPPGAESWLDFSDRVGAFLRSLGGIGSGAETVIAITHNGVIRVSRQLVGGRRAVGHALGHEPHLVPLCIEPHVGAPSDPMAHGASQ